ncbi:MAG: lysophospholipase L1-like esterase [Oceanospirillaceae bacterium]|jgi:lysophospholipase L1-like esterase
MRMQDILVYSDSLTWGIIPNTRRRLSFNQRWPGVFENKLKEEGFAIKVMENCLNGRRTAWDDPFKEGRNGSIGFAQILEMHAPLQLVIIMLGTNDFQCTHNNNAWMSAQGMSKLLNIVKTAPIEPGMPIPHILVVSPPEMADPKGVLVSKFIDSKIRSIGLNQHLKSVCSQHKVHFFDAATVTDASVVDGIHLDQDQHLVLGKAIANVVKELLLINKMDEITI